MASPVRALDHSRGLTQYVHRIWQLSQGLPEATIYCVHQSNDGYLWLGTLTGLVRFDGIRFARIGAEGPGSLGRAPIQSIAEGKDGSLWLGTDGAGVYELRNDAVAGHWGRKEGLPSERVRAVAFDEKGRLWIGTSAGLARLDGSSVTVVAERADIRAMCVQGETVVAGGSGNALIRAPLAGGAPSGEVLDGLPPGATVQALCADGDTRTLWIGSSSGLLALQDGREHRITRVEGLADDSVLSLRLTSDDTLWAATRDGFSRIRRHTPGGELAVESFRGQDGLSQSTVFDLAEDAEGSLWVATKHGLNQFLDGRTIPLTAREGLASNDTGPVLQDRSGVMWIGSLDAGLSRFDGNGFQTLTVADGLPSNRILALAQGAPGGAGRQDEMWVGTDRGLVRLEGGKPRQIITRGLPSERITAIARSDEGQMWIGTDRGLALVVDQSVRPLAIGGGRDLDVGGISALLGSRDGSVVVAGTSGRVVRMQGSEVSDVLPSTEWGSGEESPHRGVVNTLYEDADGALWMGTTGTGLFIVEHDGKLRELSVRDGLFDDDLYAILPDDRGRIWFACSKGLFSVNEKEVKAYLRGGAGAPSRIVPMPVSPTDALKTIECRPGVSPGAARMEDGRLWFATTRGVTIVEPERLPRKLAAPPARIEDVSVDGRGVDPAEIVRLEPGRKNIDFHYTALSYIAPTRLVFRYRLEGYDKGWIEAGGRREAQYANLPPGPYTFQVEAVYTDNPWDESGVKPAAVAFTLAPAWYQHRWFIPACVLAAGLVSLLVFWIRLRVLRQRMALVVAERGRIARELHDTLLQGLSGVTMEMQALSVQLPESEQRRTLQEIIGDAARCLREARRSVAGLRDRASAANGLSQMLRTALKEVTAGRSIRTRDYLPEKSPALTATIEYSLMRIAREAMRNAVKHSNARLLEVSLSFDGRAGRLEIRDDGEGFDPAEAAEGCFGIVGMRERAAEIGAVLSIESRRGSAERAGGTTLTVDFRLSPAKGEPVDHAPAMLSATSGETNP